MSSRADHLFQFRAMEIAAAARAEASYHREREAYWRGEFDAAVQVVEETIGARVERQAITGGYAVDVVIDRGDPAAYSRMQRSFSKAQHHAGQAELYESDAAVYGSQGVRAYELTLADVQYFRLELSPRGIVLGDDEE